MRSGSRVERTRFDALEPALDAVERWAGELADDAPGRAVDLKYKRFEPAEQVIARLELAGPQRLVPSVRAGVDVHGDGSAEAFLGRVKRQAVEPRKGETACRALRRALTEES